jgi:hypothetical protein
MYSDVLRVLVAMLIGGLTAYIAQNRGRSPIVWFCIGIFFGVFGLLALFLFKPIVADRGEIEPTTIAVVGEVKPAEPETVLEKSVADLPWYYLDSQHQQYGPVTFEQLRSLWNEGKATSTTYVWSDGMADWKVINDVPLLLTLLSKE